GIVGAAPAQCESNLAGGFKFLSRGRKKLEGRTMLAALFASPRPLIIAFAALVVGFVLATSSAEWSDVRIRRLARNISTTSAASIHKLSDTRAILRHFEIMVDDYVDRLSDQMREHIERLRADLATSWEEYKRLPTYPGESDHWGEVDNEFKRVDLCLA